MSPSGWHGGEGPPMFHGRRGHRPPWWPEDMSWPPPRARWRRGGRFFLPAAFALAFLTLFALTACAASLWLATLLARGFDAVPLAGSVALGALAFAALLGVATVARSLRRLTAPLDDVLAAADRLAAGDYGARVPERGPREMRGLARAFNAMAARLHADAEQRRDLLADVTHELRTPLTVMQGHLEGMLDGVYPRDEERIEALLEETRQMSRLIEDLRTLSLAEAQALQLRPEPTDLGGLVREVAAGFRPQAEAAGIKLEVQVEEQAPQALVDPLRVHEVLANVLTNALRFTPEGGTIRVEQRSSAAGAHTIMVSDTGPGIAPEDLPYVFDRFYKSPGSQGSGLGLAIARKLVEAHGGKIEAGGAPGGGAQVTIELPG